jgi:Base plate wedge protein 53
MTYSNLSLYASTSMTNGYLDILNLKDILPASDDILFTVTQQYSLRPDLLAYDRYGEADLWWVFAVRNKDVLLDPVYDMLAGQRIYIPSNKRIRDYLGL